MSIGILKDGKLITLTDKQYKVRKAIEGEMTPKEIAIKLGYTESSYIFDALKALVKKGLIAKEGKGRNTKYYKI